MKGSGFLATQVAPRIGTLAAIALVGVTLFALLQASNLRTSSIAMPMVFSGAVLFFGILSLFDSGHVTVARPVNALLGCAGLVAYAALLYFDVRYWIAISLLIVVCFMIIGRRSWLIMLLFWLCTQGLAYGIFGAVLGVPIR